MTNDGNMNNKKIEIHTMSSKFTDTKTNSSIEVEWKMTKSRVKKVKPLDNQILEKLMKMSWRMGCQSSALLHWISVVILFMQTHTFMTDHGTIRCLYVENQ